MFVSRGARAHVCFFDEGAKHYLSPNVHTSCDPANEVRNELQCNNNKRETRRTAYTAATSWTTTRAGGKRQTLYIIIIRLFVESKRARANGKRDDR